MFEAASKAEQHAHADARSAWFYARRALELAVSRGLHARQSAEAALQGRPQRPHSLADISRTGRRPALHQGSPGQGPGEPGGSQHQEGSDC